MRHDTETINSHMRNLPQKEYNNGLRKDKVSAQSVAYGPDGFNVATVLSGDLTQVSDAIGPLPTLEGQSWPTKIAFHFEFCDPAYNTPIHLGQQRVRSTRGGFAILAAKEMEKMLARLPQFPYTLDQIKVIGIDMRSRGTAQPRICVDCFALTPEE